MICVEMKIGDGGDEPTSEQASEHLTVWARVSSTLTNVGLGGGWGTGTSRGAGQDNVQLVISAGCSDLEDNDGPVARGGVSRVLVGSELLVVGRLSMITDGFGWVG
jgi:hypothetical protein